MTVTRLQCLSVQELQRKVEVPRPGVHRAQATVRQERLLVMARCLLLQLQPVYRTMETH